MAPGRTDRLSSDREALKREFLARHGLGGVRRQPLTGDASTRAYERLWPADGPSLIFMDQPPKAETATCPPDATPEERSALGFNAEYRLAAGRVDAFVACARYLKDRGLSAPEIVAFDAAVGLAVLEDLGDGLFANEIAAGRDEAPLYDAAIDALVVLHAAAPPATLGGADIAWPLLTYDQLALTAASSLFVDWLPKLRPAFSPDAQALADWEAVWTPIRAAAEAEAEVFCHRDYHAENLLWLPTRLGPARVGLIDFQDAVKAHRVWDLSMLLHDARRQVTPEREAAALDRYLAAHSNLDRVKFLADYHALGALNVARIIGIFARLVVRDGKPRYEGFLPRLWGYLDLCLADPVLGELKAWFDAHVPAEARR
ncbi:MAG: aminoglycoside phosphotransferase [Caulobacter sp.]|nr:aminoglycoside phosphotransferase [Caulobacter sp.]